MTGLGGLKGGSTVMLYVTGNPWSIAVQVSVAEVVPVFDAVTDTLNVFTLHILGRKEMRHASLTVDVPIVLARGNIM